MNGTGNMQDISAETVPVKKIGDRSRMGWGHTYFFRRGDAIKIGHSAIPKQRKSQIQVAFPDDVEVLAIVPSSLISEPAAHAKFAHLRVRGEWFRTSPELLLFIEEMKSKAARYRDRPVRRPPPNAEVKEMLSCLHGLRISHPGNDAITIRATIAHAGLARGTWTHGSWLVWRRAVRELNALTAGAVSWLLDYKPRIRVQAAT